MRPQQTVVERLDFVAKRIPGLKFTPPTQQPGDEQFYDCFMSCDMYYIEIKVDQSHQSVKDVIISHSNSPAGISCPVLRKVLAEQDFETFAKHLSGLHSIYQINTNDKKVKQRAYPALTALENDLSILYDHQRRRIPSCHDLVHKSPIGVMEPRRGGLPVKLTYFITPYDLVDATQKTFISLSVDNIMEKNLGLSATVEIEGSSPHKIQIKSLITQNNLSNLPLYAPFNGQNSEKLPAQFVLKLSQPLPMLNTSISQIITEINEPATIKEHLSSIMTNSKDSIISLIARQELDLNKGLFGRTTTAETLKGVDTEMFDLKRQVYSIKLPDQHHTYHIIDNYLEKPEGVYIEKIPFTHPTSIPSILKVLRQQALFNSVIGSCIRRNKSSNGTCTNPTSSTADENNPAKSNHQHPSRESLATLEIDFKDITCRLYALDKESVCSEDFATKTLQRCWSIPVTLRSVMKKCNETRLALLEDSNKRRERELQELLTTNPSTANQEPTPINLTQETLLQSRMSHSNVPAPPEKAANPRDLNSIAEFLSNKVNSLSSTAADKANQTASGTSAENNRTNMLKKFSCKPKVKQTTTTGKSQAGNKILSLMLKRQSSTGAANDDPSLKGPTPKKAKTKNVTGESTSTTLDGPPPPVLMTTKLISPDVAIAARLNSIKQQQSKQTGVNSVLKDSSMSLIKTPKPPASLTASVVNTALSSNASSINQTVNNIRLKSQMTNGTSAAIAAGKSRKSSIGAVLDRLVGNVTPEQQQGNLISQLTSGLDTSLQQSPRGTLDASKISLNGGAKKNPKAPGGDQFAIKQGSSGGGLKLTVTKTKPNIITPSLSTPGTGQQSATPTGPTVATASSISTSTTISSATPSGPTTSSTTSTTSNKQSDASKILDLGSVAPSIRYTIPKISKTQTASQAASAQQNSSDTNSSSQNDSSTTQTSDDTSNPSSSGNQSSAPSSTTTANLAKRTTSNPFNRNIGTNRNPVSSSTHPPNRTTSNPLANASSNRPSSSTNSSGNSTNNNNNNDSSGHTLNRITSSSINQNLQQRQSVMNRSVNLLPQPHFASPTPSSASSTLNSSSLPAAPQRLLNPSSAALAQQQAAAQLIRQQPALSQMFSFRLPQPTPQNIFSNVNDLNLIASQVALLNQQQQLQQQQAQQLQFQQQVQQHIQAQQLLKSQATPASTDNPAPTVSLQSRVTSSSEGEPDNAAQKIRESNLPSSTPSSPTECGLGETVVQPALIPIDSLEERHHGSPDVDHDDESDRLSIVDMNEHAASDSTSGTPKPSGFESPMAGLHEFSVTGSPSLKPASRTLDSSENSTDMISVSGQSQAQSLPSVGPSEPMVRPESSISMGDSFKEQLDEQNSKANNDAIVITQSPQSSTAPSTADASNLA